MYDTDKYQGYDVALKKLIAYREDRLLRQAESGRNATFAIFQLKQSKNGGYTDREAGAAGEVKLTLKLDTAGVSD